MRTAITSPELLARLRAVRRDLHRHPELGFEEVRTQEVVEAFLREHGYRPRRCAETGVVADLRPGEAPAVALRADLDALPMQETTELPYRSVHEGRAHKCGHDGHTAILLGVAATLAAERESWPGNVRLLFQPAEEGVRGGGAKVMVAEGALEGVAEVYGLHNWPGFPKGEVRVAPGPVMAAVDNLEIAVRGRGGHASQPHLCRDPVLAGSALVTALQAVVSRSLAGSENAVVSITAFHAGEANNVIPETAALRGTVRTFDEGVRERVHRRLREIASGVAAAHGVAIDLDIRPEYPVVVNDPACAEAVRQAAAAVAGADRVTSEGLPLSVSEDFAWMARKVPGAYFFLGAGDPVGETPGCHHPDFDFDDDLLPLGIGVFVDLARRRASSPRTRPGPGSTTADPTGRR